MPQFSLKEKERYVLPFYEFLCNDCDVEYCESCKYEDAKEGTYLKVKCPKCGSGDKERLLSSYVATFANPRGTSKEDSFSYMAGHNMEGAKDCRRHAEEFSHMGTAGQPNFYDTIDDVSCGEHEGEVK